MLTHLTHLRLIKKLLVTTASPSEHVPSKNLSKSLSSKGYSLQMLTAGSVRDTNYVHTNLKFNNDAIIVRSQKFSKALQLPYSKGYTQGIWTLEYVRGTNKG